MTMLIILTRKLAKKDKNIKCNCGIEDNGYLLHRDWCNIVKKDKSAQCRHSNSTVKDINEVQDE